MKKFFVLMLCFCAFAGPRTIHGAEKDGGALRIVTTIFPEYDWVREILGSVDAEVTLLLDRGVDLHSYQPTVDDMVRIAACDLFIYVGGASDTWVLDALKNAVNEHQITIGLLDVLGSSVREEEDVEGMERGEGHEDGPEADEHVWLSLKNAAAICRRIAGALSELDPRHKAAFEANAARYTAKLSVLDKEYQAVVDGAARRVLLFGDRFPFRYLVDDYGLKYYAAFAGCSAETEASFETVMFLAGKVEELGLPCVLTLEGTRHGLAGTIVANTDTTNQQVLSMDSMQSTALKDIEAGATYLSIMERNLRTLSAALN